MTGIALFGHGGQLASAIYALRQRDLSITPFTRAACDVTDRDAVHDAVARTRPAVVINAAAYTAVDRAESEPERAFAVNRSGAANLAAAAKSAGAAFIHVSTDYVFDGSKSGPYVETDAVAPLGVYGRSKAEGETAILEIMPANAVILRTAWVYGLQGANFVKTMLRLGAERELVRVVNDQRGSPTFAHDLAVAILDLARELQAGPSRIYHVTGQGAATWFEVAQEIFATTAKRGLRTPRLEAITTAEYPTPAKRPANSVLDCSLFERDYGIALPLWRDGLHRMLAAHLDGAP